MRASISSGFSVESGRVSARTLKNGAVCTNSVIAPRTSPSTTTCTVPSGCLPTWRIRQNVPIVYRPSGSGCSSSSFFCATSRIMRSAVRAASSAASDFGRPTPRGTTMPGSTTVPLSGSSGSTLGYVTGSCVLDASGAAWIFSGFSSDFCSGLCSDMNASLGSAMSGSHYHPMCPTIYIRIRAPPARRFPPAGVAAGSHVILTGLHTPKNGDGAVRPRPGRVRIDFCPADLAAGHRVIPAPIGVSGRFLLGQFLEIRRGQEDRFGPLVHRLPRDDAALDVAALGDIVHDIEHDLL